MIEGSTATHNRPLKAIAKQKTKEMVSARFMSPDPVFIGADSLTLWEQVTCAKPLRQNPSEDKIDELIVAIQREIKHHDLDTFPLEVKPGKQVTVTGCPRCQKHFGTIRLV
jgi:hypothetical protein